MTKGRTFLGRLARDVRGNTIALTAAAMMPLAGLIGGGVDMSRLYLTKTRLQQACDAGALAGRKAMGAGSWTTGANSTNAKAEAMFGGNFLQGAYGTDTLTKSYTEQDGVVTGFATVAVPMTIMRVFGMSNRTLRVTCTAKMEIPNTDVMFVLDTTGSMMCAPGQTMCFSPAPSGTSKMDGLKSAIKCFYEALERVNTPEVCGNDPSASTATTTAQIRFGFVPYAVNVNVGRLLPNSYLADSWTYQSRVYAWDGSTYDTSTSSSSWTFVSGSKTTGSTTTQSSCPSNTYSYSDSNGSPSSATAPDGTITTTQTVTRTETGIKYSCSYNWMTHKYSVTPTTYNSYVTQSTTTTTQSPHYAYTYKPVTLDVSGLKAGGSNWNASVSLPVGTNGANTSVTWDGCIEERQTYQNTNGSPENDWSPIPASAYDMNIDLVPNDATPGSKWGPLLNGAVWGRYSGSTNNRVFANLTTSSDLNHNNSYSCPTPAKKLAEYRTSTDLVNYVNSLTPNGATYHDIGMLWGARLLSPTGIFASENAMTPSGRSIQRHLIFMTDGDTNTTHTDYSAYGIGFYDRRQTSYDPSDTQMDNMTNARLVALCTAIKNQNITLWVISYGGGINATTEARLAACATPNHYYAASDNAALMAQFKQIASQISELRLTS